jgi:hypothetical protein
MKFLVLLPALLCSRYSLNNILFTKSKEHYLCNIIFDEVLEVTGFELYLKEGSSSDQCFGIVYS